MCIGTIIMVATTPTIPGSILESTQGILEMKGLLTAGSSSFPSFIPLQGPTTENPRAGNYAVATAKTRPWLSTPIGATTTKSRKSKAQVVISNPLFTECATLTTDPFWISIFTQAAIGKFPRGFSYKENILTYKRGVKISSIEVPTEATLAKDACIMFFGKMAGLLSESDQERTRHEYDQRMLEKVALKSCTWSDIKKKKIRDLLIGTFVQDISRIFELTDKEDDQLSTIVSIGFLLGHFQGKNVAFENGRITAIHGLMYDPNNRIFYLDASLVPKVTKSSKSKKTDEEGKEGKNLSFLNLWVKFLDNLEKKMEVPSVRWTPGDNGPLLASSSSGILSRTGSSAPATPTIPTRGITILMSNLLPPNFITTIPPNIPLVISTTEILV